MGDRATTMHLSNHFIVATKGGLKRRAFRLACTALIIGLTSWLPSIPRSVALDLPTGVHQPTKPTIDPTELEAFVDESVHSSMQRDDIAGVGVAIVDGSGPLLIKGYGLAGSDRTVDADTLFEVQSISKTLVWIALMQLVEQGRIHLEDPINAHLPNSLRIPDEGFRKAILIRDLIDHTAGFEDSALGHLFVDRADKLLPLDDYLARYRVHRVREPGELQIYSNYGGALGGALVAHVSGMSWEDYAEQRIIRPLAMGTATYRQPYSEQLAEKTALPSPMPATSAALLTEGFRRGTAGIEIAPREFTADFPAGSLAASPKSMAAYMSALLNPEIMARAGVLKAETVLSMRTPIFKGPAGFGDMRFGFQSFALPGDIEAFGHGGDSIYQVSSMTLIPSAGFGIFLSANTASARALIVTLRQKLVSKFFNAVLTPAQYRPDAVAEARSYAGNYRNLRRPYFRTERGIYDLVIASASLVAQANGDLRMLTLLNPPRLLVPMGGGVYRDGNGPDRVAFRPLNGKIGMYEPFSEAAWERLGFLASPNLELWTIALTLMAALLCIGSAFRRIRELRHDTGVRHYATAIVTMAAVAWLAGFIFLASFFAKGLTSLNGGEIIWWYPSTALVCACWTFAAAAALTLASVPSLIAVTRINDWSAWRKITHALSVSVFLACSATFVHLGFIGFTGW
jgi:CubicO group peptidase (beta-lactamase class C family)